MHKPTQPNVMETATQPRRGTRHLLRTPAAATSIKVNNPPPYLKDKMLAQPGSKCKMQAPAARVNGRPSRQNIDVQVGNLTSRDPGNLPKRPPRASNGKHGNSSLKRRSGDLMEYVKRTKGLKESRGGSLPGHLVGIPLMQAWTSLLVPLCNP